jgi:hypothetical protein
MQIAGLALTIAYAAFIVWIYATEPRTFKEVATSAEVASGTYQINQEKFDIRVTLCSCATSFGRRATNGSARIRRRAMRERSFNIAYSFYREGWGRVYYDQALFKQGWEAPTAPPTLVSTVKLTIDDPNLQMHPFPS